jgi:hypothetical protein
VSHVVGWVAPPGAGEEPSSAGAPGARPPLTEADGAALLDARRDAALKRLPATEEIGRALAERRLSVREAVQRLRALHAGDTRFWEALKLRVGRDEDERLARHVILLAVLWLEDEPERARALWQSLEAELKDEERIGASASGPA